MAPNNKVDAPAQKYMASQQSPWQVVANNKVGPSPYWAGKSSITLAPAKTNCAGPTYAPQWCQLNRSAHGRLYSPVENTTNAPSIRNASQIATTQWRPTACARWFATKHQATATSRACNSTSCCQLISSMPFVRRHHASVVAVQKIARRIAALLKSVRRSTSRQRKIQSSDAEQAHTIETMLGLGVARSRKNSNASSMLPTTSSRLIGTGMVFPALKILFASKSANAKPMPRYVAIATNLSAMYLSSARFQLGEMGSLSDPAG